MKTTLEATELAELIRRVFRPRSGEERLGVLLDLPDEAVPDDEAWRDRRRLAVEWVRALEARPDLGWTPELVLYRNAGANNADLPAQALVHRGGALPERAEQLPERELVSLDELLARLPIVLAPTRFSATAPLKVAARRLGFRAATMPGFRRDMIPALRLDYGEVERRVRLLADRLTRAVGAEIRFGCGGKELGLDLDLRHRAAHVSGGLVTEPGTAGNLPSGEAYIVPYEGELAGRPSQTAGLLPVQLEGELVRYRFEQNRAVEVLPGGPVAAREAERLVEEPAYGNLAELGLGVLRDFGIDPVGEVLLDEKLGLHLAFGRSEHFGGQVGPSDFRDPRRVVHIDRVYLPELQPEVSVRRCELIYGEHERELLLRDDRYSIRFD